MYYLNFVVPVTRKWETCLTTCAESKVKPCSVVKPGFLNPASSVCRRCLIEVSWIPPHPYVYVVWSRFPDSRLQSVCVVWLQVSREMHHYSTDIEEREEGGTPAIIESIRTGLAFQLKAAVTEKLIFARDEDLCWYVRLFNFCKTAFFVDIYVVFSYKLCVYTN